jgi:ABC-2 type transport system ATP-binding protein
MSTLQVSGLTKRFGDVVAVDHLTFSPRPERITGFLGPNGAGKTTTLRMMLGLVEPTAGTATIDGVPYRALPHPIRRVGAVLDASGFHPGRRAADHLRTIATAAGLAPSRVDAVLHEVGLSPAASRRVGGFSLGMRQRLGLAVALLGEPDVLILDEPTNGLDPEGVSWLRHFLRGFAGRGGTALVSSHLLAEVAQTADDVLIIAAGRLVAHCPLAELSRGHDAVRARSPRAADLIGALEGRGINAQLTGPDEVTAFGTTTDAVAVAAAGASIVLFELTAGGTDLEDTFLRLTRGAA